MKPLFHIFCAALIASVWFGCSDSTSTRAPKPSNPWPSAAGSAGSGAKPTATGGSGQTSQQPAAAQQKPKAPAKSLVETLIERRQAKKPVFLADNVREPESPAMTALGEELTAKGVRFTRPKWPKYQYYLNQIIPMTRRSEGLWLVFDHSLEGLCATLDRDYLAHHAVTYQKKFGTLTLMKVANKFADADSQKIALEPITPTGGIITNIVFTNDGEYMFDSSKSGTIRWFSRTSERKGRIMRMPRAKDGQDGIFTGGESGMIGFALHPDFPSNPKVYLHYNWKLKTGERNAIVSEWTANIGDDEISFVNERRLLEIEQSYDNHNAGCLVFGPDRFLYIAVGDGGVGKWTIGRSPAGSLRGKVLRIDVEQKDPGKEYAVPADNPFVGDDAFPPETWAWGFRNPWRLSFVPDGRLLASDIGEDVNEELTYVIRGKHHGWPYYEGLHERNKWTIEAPYQPPLVPYGREFGMSVIAGNIYEGDDVPSLKGKYIFCDYLSGRIWAFDLPDASTTLSIQQMDELARWPMLMSTVAKDPDGNLFFGAHNGQILRLTNITESNGSAAATAAVPKTKADPQTARGLFSDDYVGPAPAMVATAAQRTLGAKLFHDVRLSADGSTACATCHDPKQYGQDGKTVTDGLGKDVIARNTPSIFNVGRQFAQFRDYRAETVEAAVAVSLVDHSGFESAAAAADRIASIDEYRDAFTAAFPNAGTPVSADNISAAIGGFLRQLNTPSRWEAFLDGDDGALSEPELIGLNEFINAGCITCHQYRGLGGGLPQKLGLVKPWQGADKGRGRIDATHGQEYFFKVSNLFNVAETAPYYHDGSMKTLEDAVRNMAEIQLGRQLSDPQCEAIATFLKALSGTPPQ